ncbi:Arm DNA-binding domain-containing protein [Bacillus aerius]|uniref:Arm DNA-binding domain-containing protein n=1 Tax=Bacillus aerius TaxID=293388 RepID=UPI00247DD28E|nr:Arm DNA-binding domain-containing protein [Bacillus aerius]MDH6598423.1 hypothetical protein [Bacillus aerius]
MASFRQHENGTWEYRIRYKDKRTEKYKEKSKRGFKTKKEARIAAEKTAHDLEYVGFDSTNETVGGYFPDWLEIYKKPSVKKQPTLYKKELLESIFYLDGNIIV